MKEILQHGKSNATVQTLEHLIELRIELRTRSHPSDLSLSQVLVQPLVEMLPPFKQHGMTDQLEPRRELQALIHKHFFQLLRRNISCVLRLVRVSFDVDIGFDEEDVINCVL